jgi:hypothetical protein
LFFSSSLKQVFHMQIKWTGKEAYSHGRVLNLDIDAGRAVAQQRAGLGGKLLRLSRNSSGARRQFT